MNKMIKHSGLSISEDRFPICSKEPTLLLAKNRENPAEVIIDKPGLYPVVKPHENYYAFRQVFCIH